MKVKYILFLFGLVSICSCSGSQENQTQNDSLRLVEELPQIADKTPTTPNQEEIEEYPDFGKFPFGCPTLVRFQFADEWNIIDYSGTANMGHNINQKALLEINTCLQDINHSLSIPKPEMKSVEPFNYKMGQMLTCNDVGATDSVLISLPNMGPYEVYYAFSNFDSDKPKETLVTPEDCLEYGNLLLVDPKTRKTQVLNLYLLKAKDNNIDLRLFYIDEYKTIHIREVFCDQINCKMKELFNVTIDDNGKIKVNRE